MSAKVYSLDFDGHSFSSDINWWSTVSIVI
jgi:hypothetical protein